MICDDPGGRIPQCSTTKITEALDSRGFKTDKYREQTWELHFFVQGTNDECKVRDRLVPGNVWGLPYTFPDYSFTKDDSVRADGTSKPYPLQSYDVQCIGWELWEVTARYGWSGADFSNPSKSKLPLNISLSTRGGNVRITQSIKTLQKFPNRSIATDDVIAPDFSGAIEWDGKAVRGINVPSPLTRYSESWVFSRPEVFYGVETFEQKQDLGNENDADPTKVFWTSLLNVWENYTGCVHGPVRENPDYVDDPTDEHKAAYLKEPAKQRAGFRQWPIGSVLLDNVGLRQVGLNHYEVTFDFLIRPQYNEPIPNSVDPADATTGITDGWDHLWYYQEQVSKKVAVENNTDWDVTAPQPKFGYIERTIPRRNFENLGIGTDIMGWQPNAYDCDSYDLMTHWKTACQQQIYTP